MGGNTERLPLQELFVFIYTALSVQCINPFCLKMKLVFSGQDKILPVFININNTTHEILIRTLNDRE